jgi:hypothetical protein
MFQVILCHHDVGLIKFIVITYFQKHKESWIEKEQKPSDIPDGWNPLSYRLSKYAILYGGRFLIHKWEEKRNRPRGEEKLKEKLKMSDGANYIIICHQSYCEWEDAVQSLGPLFFREVEGEVLSGLWL